MDKDPKIIEHKVEKATELPPILVAEEEHMTELPQMYSKMLQIKAWVINNKCLRKILIPMRN